MDVIQKTNQSHKQAENLIKYQPGGKALPAHSEEGINSGNTFRGSGKKRRLRRINNLVVNQQARPSPRHEIAHQSGVFSTTKQNRKIKPAITSGLLTSQPASDKPNKNAKKKSDAINEPEPHQPIPHKRVLRDISNTDQPGTTRNSDIEAKTVPPTETVTVTAVPDTVKQLHQTLRSYIELTNLGQSKKWLSNYQLANPDIDISQLSNAIDQALDLYEMFAMIEIIFRFSEAIEASHPEVSQQYKNIIQNLVNNLSEDMGVESDARKKREPVTSKSQTLVKELFHQTLQAIRGLKFNHELRLFFDGQTEARREFMQMMSTALRAGNVFDIANFVGDSTGLETAAETVGRLNDSVARDIRNGNFNSAGMSGFRANVAFFVLHYGLDTGSYPISNIQASHITWLYQQQAQPVIDLGSDILYMDIRPMFQLNIIFLPRYMETVSIKPTRTGVCQGSAIAGLITGFASSQQTATSNSIASFFGPGNTYSYIPTHIPMLLQDLYTLALTLLASSLQNRPMSTDAANTLVTSREYYGARIKSMYWSNMSNLILAATNAYRGTPVSNLNGILNILSTDLSNQLSARPGPITLSLQAQLYIYNPDIDFHDHVIRIAMATSSSQSSPNSFMLVVEDTLVGLFTIRAPSYDELLRRAMSGALSFLSGMYRIPYIGDSSSISSHRLLIFEDSELAALGTITPLPYSALTLRDIVSEPIAGYRRLEQRRVLELIREYTQTVFSEAAQNLVWVDPSPDHVPDPDMVSTQDPIVFQMREVIAQVRFAINSENRYRIMPSVISLLSNHVSSILYAARVHFQTLGQPDSGVDRQMQQLFVTLSIPSGPSGLSWPNNDVGLSELLELIQARDQQEIANPGAALLRPEWNATIPGTDAGGATGGGNVLSLAALLSQMEQQTGSSTGMPVGNSDVPPDATAGQEYDRTMRDLAADIQAAIPEQLPDLTTQEEDVALPEIPDPQIDSFSGIAIIAALSPQAIVIVMDGLSPEDSAAVIRLLSAKKAAEVIRLLPVTGAANVIRQLSAEDSAAIIAELTPQAAAAIIDMLSPQTAAPVLAQLLPTFAAQVIAEVAEKDSQAAANIITSVSLSKAMAVIAKLDSLTAANIIARMPLKRATTVITNMDPQKAANIIARMPLEKAAAIIVRIAEKNSKKAADIIAELSPQAAAPVIAAMDPDNAAPIMNQLPSTDSENIMREVERLSVPLTTAHSPLGDFAAGGNSKDDESAAGNPGPPGDLEGAANQGVAGQPENSGNQGVSGGGGPGGSGGAGGSRDSAGARDAQDTVAGEMAKGTENTGKNSWIGPIAGGGVTTVTVTSLIYRYISLRTGMGLKAQAQALSRLVNNAANKVFGRTVKPDEPLTPEERPLIEREVERRGGLRQRIRVCEERMRRSVDGGCYPEGEEVENKAGENEGDQLTEDIEGEADVALDEGLEGGLKEGLETADLGEGLETADLGEGLEAADLGEGLEAADLGEGLEAADLGEGLEAAGLDTGLEAGLETGIDSALMEGVGEVGAEFLAEEGFAYIGESLAVESLAMEFGAVGTVVGFFIAEIIFVIQERELLKALFAGPEEAKAALKGLLEDLKGYTEQEFRTAHSELYPHHPAWEMHPYGRAKEEILWIQLRMQRNFFIGGFKGFGGLVRELFRNDDDSLSTYRDDIVKEDRDNIRNRRSVNSEGGTDANQLPAVDAHIINTVNGKAQKVRIHGDLLRKITSSHQPRQISIVDARPCPADPYSENPESTTTPESGALNTTSTLSPDSSVTLGRPLPEIMNEIILELRNDFMEDWASYLSSITPVNAWLSVPEDKVNDYIESTSVFFSGAMIQDRLKAAGIQCDRNTVSRSELKVATDIFKEQMLLASDYLFRQAGMVRDGIIRDLYVRSNQLKLHGIHPSGQQEEPVPEDRRESLLTEMDEVMGQLLWASSAYFQQNRIDREYYIAQAESLFTRGAGRPSGTVATTTGTPAVESLPGTVVNKRLQRHLDHYLKNLNQILLKRSGKMAGTFRKEFAGTLQTIQRASVQQEPRIITEDARITNGEEGAAVEYAMEGFESGDRYKTKGKFLVMLEQKTENMDTFATGHVERTIGKVEHELLATSGHNQPGAMDGRKKEYLDLIRRQQSLFADSMRVMKTVWTHRIEQKIPAMLELTPEIPWPEKISQWLVIDKLQGLMQETRNKLANGINDYVKSFGVTYDNGFITEEDVQVSEWNVFWRRLNKDILTKIKEICPEDQIPHARLGAVLQVYQSAELEACNFYTSQAGELARRPVKSLLARYREIMAPYLELHRDDVPESQRLGLIESYNIPVHYFGHPSQIKQWITQIYQSYAAYVGQQVDHKNLIKQPAVLERTLARSLSLVDTANPLPENPAAVFYSEALAQWRKTARGMLRGQLGELVGFSLKDYEFFLNSGLIHTMFKIEGSDQLFTQEKAAYLKLHENSLEKKQLAEKLVTRRLANLTRYLKSAPNGFTSSNSGSLNDIRELIDSETEWANKQLYFMKVHGMERLYKDWKTNVLEIYSDSTEKSVKSFDEYHKIMAGDLPSTETLTTTELTTTELTTTELTTTEKPSLPKRHHRHHPRHHKNIPIAPERADYLQPGRQRRSVAKSIDQDIGNIPVETDPGDITSGTSSSQKGLLFDAADLSLGLLSRLSDMFSGKPAQEPFQASRVVDQKTGGSNANGAFGANGANSTHSTNSTHDTGGTGVERHVFQVQAYYNGHCQDQDQPSCEPTRSMVAMRGNTREACAVMGKPGESQCMIFSNQPANHAEQSNPDNPGHLPSTKKASLLDALEGNARVAWQQDTGVLQNDLHDLRFPGTTNEPLSALVKRAADLGPLPAGFAPGAPGDNGFTYGHQQTMNLTCNTGMTECTLDREPREPPLSVISKFKAIVNRARAAANAGLQNHWSATAMDFSHNSLELLPALACSLNDRTLVPSRYVDDSRGVFPVKADLPPQPEPAVPPCSTAPSTSTAAASGNPVRPRNRSFSEWLSYLWNYGIRDESSPAGSTGPAITLDQSPGMSLLRDCYCVAKPLHREVIRFIDDLKASGSPDDDWHKDDIIPMAVLWRKGATEAGEVPVNLFLDEVLHSPELGLDHESVRNIFAFDDQGELSIRGRHNVFPFDGQGKLRILGRKAGGGLFYQSRQGGAKTGHARELARCMLRAMARQRLPQKMSGKSLDASIFKRVRQLQGQQQGQQQPLWEQQEILDRLKALSRPPLSFPLASAPVLSLLQAGLEKEEQEEVVVDVVEAAKRKFLELSPGDQLEALEALLKQPDLYGLDCKYEWISAVQEALSSESVSPADSENAWYLLAYQFDIRHGVRREVAGKVKVMDLVRKVADPADEMVQRALAGLLFDRLPVSATIYEQSLPGNHPRSVALPFQYHDYDESLSVSLINDYEMIKSEIGRQIRESGNVKDTEEDDPLLEKQINELSVYCLQNYLEKQDKGHEPDISAVVMEELELDEKEIEDTAFFD